MKNNCITVAFAGGGTGGHIYPGLAVADFLREKIESQNKEVRIVWIGSRGKMDKDIVNNAVFSNAGVCGGQASKKSIEKFYGIPSGKLRRYFSLKNFIDFFKIGFGFIGAFFILLKERPAFLFSKGGFVSVPPCVAARVLGIKVYTHECDFTPGLATRINSKFAHKILLSYEETKNYFKNFASEKFIVTGNPVRPIFYGADAKIGLDFISAHCSLPLLLITGGSLGAAQINELVAQNIEWLCQHFVVVHQTGRSAAQMPQNVSEAVRQNYHPYEFIYAEMPHVFAAADVVLSRAGANSIWEAAVLAKPMVLLPLEGSGTRGDQVDNAEFFAKNGAAIVIRKAEANSEKLKEALSALLEKNARDKFSEACKRITGAEKPAQKIAQILYEDIVVEGER